MVLLGQVEMGWLSSFLLAALHSFWHVSMKGPPGETACLSARWGEAALWPCSLHTAGMLEGQVGDRGLGLGTLRLEGNGGAMTFNNPQMTFPKP